MAWGDKIKEGRGWGELVLTFQGSRNEELIRLEVLGCLKATIIIMDMEKQRDGERWRKGVVVLVAAPFQGHLTPMLELGSILHSRGFSITVAHTLFNPPNPSNHPHFSFLPFSHPQHSNTPISSHNLTTITSTLNTNCASPLKHSLLLHMNQHNVLCLIYDGLMHFADSVARQLNIPSLLLRTTSVTNLLAYHALLHQQNLPNFKDREGWREMEVPNLEAVRFKDLPNFNCPDSEALLKQLKKTVGVRPSLGVIFNTVECLEAQYINKLHQQYLKVPIFAIGPLHLMARQHSSSSSSSSFLKEDYTCIDWLNKQSPRSVLYLSLGSIASWDQKQLTQMARGLVNCNQPFLWVVRANHNIIVNVVGDEEVKKGIEERGCVVRWAPQKEVLAHEAVGGFWSHCGWNSTLESMSEGVPMICQPYFGDQTINSRLLTHVWKLGLQIQYNNNNNNAIEEGEIEKAVTRLLVDEEGKEMWKRAQEMKHHIRQAVTQPAASSYNALDSLVHHLLSLCL
ncbi:UDP-glucose iridoid glucosyltransferase-like [Senna tora]|uniref:UDP-glucose iridoid glucosyltransferase-like n=1 Tax=Senna tora TaxID=362788 RepID=A0A834SQL1_9FABA|nr:UDP-glucose iridoid glucosyltransferase-like [Senna tora]